MAVAREWGQEGKEKEASSELHLILFASSSPCFWSIVADLEFIVPELNSITPERSICGKKLLPLHTVAIIRLKNPNI